MKTGILLINTGTPDEPTEPAIAAYLEEFLNDPMIIEAPALVRKHIISKAVKNRPPRTVGYYRQFWTEKGSPFMLTSFKQRDRLRIELSARIAEPTQVALAMRYGKPSIAAGLAELRDGGCERVVLLPLYPQNVAVCAGTCLAAARAELAALAEEGWEPQVLEIPSFHDQPAYRKALAASVAKEWQYGPGAKLVVSFHSTMMDHIKKDDTYLVQCTETRDWLARDLGLPDEDVLLTFQSRYDNRKWLQPFTEGVIEELRRKGVTNVCVICPGFVAENIETAIEVNVLMRKTFYGASNEPARAGKGAHFTFVPCLNAGSGLVKALSDVIVECLAAADAEA